MPSTPSPLLRIQLMATGDQAGQWGDTTNTNLGTLLEGAIAGLASVSVTSANQALSVVDYVADQSRMAILSLSTTTTADFNVYAPPNVTKTYVIQNTSAYTATIYNSTTVGGTTAAGSGVSVPAGGVAYVFSNGTNCFSLNSVFGNFNIVGSARRITGDFSNATIASRVIFQTSTTNGQTSISAIPNGTGSDSNFAVWNNPDTANGSVGAFGASSSEVSVSSLKTGTGTYLPLIFYTGGSERMRIDTSGNVGIGTNAPAYTLDIDKASANFRVRDASGGNDVAIRSIAGPVSLIGSVSNTPIGFTTNNTEHIRIDTSGNVAIGLPGPFSDKLTVAVASGAVYVATNNGTVNMVSGISAGNVGLMGTTTNHDLLLYANNAERGRFTGTGLFQFNSGYGSVATAYGCRAWINFDGFSGSIGTGRGSGNVSSVTDLGGGGGIYLINFSTAMPDTNYAVTGTANGRNSHPARVVGAGYSGDTFSTSAVQIRTGTAGGSGANGTTEDCEYVFVAIFR